MAELIPVEHDPFAGPPPASAGGFGNVSVTPRGGSSRQPQLVPVDHDPFAEKQPTSTVSDVAQAIPSGLAKGAIGLAGLPDTIAGLWQQGGDAVLDAMENYLGLPKGWATETKGYIQQGREQSAMRGLPSAAGMRQALEENVTGPLYEPQTTAGKFAGTVAEFVPGAGRRLLSLAVAPGVVSETAGQVTAGTKYEPVARAGGAVAGGLTGGLAGARASTPRAAISQNMSPQVTSDVVDRAGQLIADAEAQGIRLTWPEAIEQVSPGSGLPNIQRILESTSDSRATMADFFAGRPGQFDNAVGQVFDKVTPAAPNPSAIGPAAGRAAEDTLNDVRGVINKASEPFYDAASTVRLTPQEMQRVRALPGYREARDAVRGDPQLARYVKGLPDDSVGFLNEVKKYLDQAAENANRPLAQNPNMQRAAGYGQDATAARAIAENASPDYAVALEIQRSAREQFLQPLLDGPLGKLAKRDLDTNRAINVLFPKNPLPNSAEEVATAVRSLGKRNSYAARNLVRAYAESIFNEATRSLQTGANQFGAANFAKQIAGNPQQRQNLEAAIRSLGSDGDSIWRGFNRFLEIAEASGKRQRPGSLTAFNAKELQDLSTGGTVANATKTGASPSKWLGMISDAVSRWQLGRNLNELASILTDPKAGRLLRAIANEPATSQKAQLLGAQIIRLYAITDAKAAEPGNESKSR